MRLMEGAWAKSCSAREAERESLGRENKEGFMGEAEFEVSLVFFVYIFFKCCGGHMCHTHV